MKKIILITIIALFTGCATVKLATPSQTDVDRVSSKYPGYSLTDLNHGKMLFEQHCADCHRLKDPTKRSEEQWETVVPKMVRNVNKKEGNVLDTNGEQAILKYLVTMSDSKATK
ncbi:hypothetical protein FRZ67_05610 [Panacibacter ginsenosidivorans]|uniref:Cytochrome c domain-containing protein n=1 Tax=Panacibacter ginsenosidivorans TaxID=1813871 RepID=A0A5B8V7B3_9BACT|nr:hypothetical protein [Panacibacter ginsenosidivorans]QEC66803.1 hypothetical protein FRZ67_05610 [Panacibacter ginsenosidivorans]